jgi:hypothetical protein
MTTPYLSIVAASRNDDHGGDPLVRTQIFINNFVRQCDRYQLSAELIIVDWNPVPDRPGLASVLSIPSGTTHCRTRVITVPTVLHRRLKYADKLPFFQMIAKNVGIRRARGNFILATNIDIIFSDELFRFIARQKLDSKKLYRVDRYDIRNGLARDCALDQSIEYAWNNPIRTNRRYQPSDLVEHLYGAEPFRKTCVPEPVFCSAPDGVQVIEEDGVWQVRPHRTVEMSHLHTNACGDFTLLSREGWYAIRGYPEFEAFSFNIDSMGFVAAHYAGYEEVSLLPPCVCFHIEHGMGSGWTPEGEKKLFARLRDAGILNPEWPVLTPLVDAMREQGQALEFNQAGWGMADFDLPEQPIGDLQPIPADKLEQLAAQAEIRQVSAIQPAYDLDRLTLAYERRVAQDRSLGNVVLTPNVGLSVGINGDGQAILGSTVNVNEEKIVLYIPDSSGSYSEQRTVVCRGFLVNRTTVILRVERFSRQFRLRFDPCQCPGIITIYSVAVFDTHRHRTVWDLTGRDLRKLIVCGTAVSMSDSWNGSSWRTKKIFRRLQNRQPQSFRVLSTGSDPQLMFPPLPSDIGFPLIITIEMKLIPCE